MGGLRYKPWACMQIVLLIPTARQDCVSVCENECMLCAWSTCRQAADGQTGVVYS